MPALSSLRNLIPLLAILLATAAFFVIDHFVISERTSDASIRKDSRQQLQVVSNNFKEVYKEFYSSTVLLADSIQLVGQSNAKDQISDLLDNGWFTGASVFIEDSLWLWQGNALSEKPSQSTGPPSTPLISIIRKSNTTYLASQHNYVALAPDSDSLRKFSIVTVKLLDQQSFLKISNEHQTELESRLGIEQSNAIHIDFLGSSSQSALFSEPLVIADDDTVGFAYFNTADLIEFKEREESRLTSLFSLLLWLIVTTILIATFFIHSDVRIILTLLLIFGVYSALGLFTVNALFELDSESLRAVNALFRIFNLSIVLILTSILRIRTEQHQSLINIYSILLLISALFPAYQALKDVISSNTIPLLSLDVIPSILMLAFYLITAFYVISLIYLLIVLIREILFESKKETSSGFLTRPRKFIAFCLLSCVSVHFLTFQLSNEFQKTRINEFRSEFLSGSSESDQNIIRNILQNASAYFSDLSTEDVDNRSFVVQEKLNRGIPLIFQNEWLDYSFDLRLIDNSGSEIASYTSDLDTPSWTQVFDMSSLQIPYEQEQITRAVNRPIIRSRPFNDLPIKYSSFKRAWIPIYKQDPESENIIAWILCTIYKEPSKLDKPLRSIISSSNNDLNDDQTVLISLYENNEISRSRFFGLPNQLDHQDFLPEFVREVPDSLSLTTESNGFIQQDEFVKLADGNILRISTSLANFNNHLYAISRFFFVVFLSGFIVSAISSIIGFKTFALFGFTKRFQYRLLDRVVFAVLFCLVALNTITSLAIKDQQNELIRSDLRDQLENLSDALLLESEMSLENPSLERATFSLDIDASLFENGILKESTAPQIYEQNILADLVPYSIFESLRQEGSLVIDESNIAGKSLLIGYASIQGGKEIIAIPTFIKSPKYSEMLLSTSSYLLGLYVIIFGIFMLASALIARNLTRPVEQIKEALQTIGEGSFDKKLPVQYEDEIGSLSEAYNEMTDKLVLAREELAKAEREGAWKEMAQQVAHEIKNPLTPMKLNLQHLERQLQNGDASPDDLKENINRITGNIITQINALDKIASDFSKFARPADEPFQQVNINELLDDIFELYKTYDDRSIELKNLKQPLRVSGVYNELRAALINLIKNSIEATESGGSIKLSLNRAEDSVKITVRDNGVGINLEDQSQIFIPSFSTKTSGTGLGLAITKKIIESHGGSIVVKSKASKGTSFTILIPRIKS